MKVMVYSIHGFDKPFLEKANYGKHELLFSELPLSLETVALSKGCQAIALFTSDNASAMVLEKLHEMGVKYIALRSVGYDHVDLKKATEFEMKVANVPAYSPYAIAEHAVALLLALNRKILQGNALFMKNDFRLDNLVGFDLHGKSVGVIGTGKIGGAFAKIMNGFGCEVLAYDIEENQDLKNEIRIQYMSLVELCQKSDIISICCPMNSQTKYMFNKSLFSIMKKGVYIINTARGGIVNSLDLLAAIEEGIVAATGLDVYENEKPIYFKDKRATKMEDSVFLSLQSHPKILMTGHQAFLTNEALEGIASTTLQNLDDWSIAGSCNNEVSCEL